MTAPSDPLVSFGAVKAILRIAGLDATVTDAAVRQSLRLIWPLDSSLAEAVRDHGTSLTDSATAAEQVRFFQRQRAARSYVKITRWVASQHNEFSVAIERAELLDEPSREFFRIAASVAGWRVHLEYGHSQNEDRRWIAVQEASHTPLLADSDEIWQEAFEYISVGDAWTAVAIGRQLAAAEQSPRVWNLLALGFAMLGETENAEFYYRRWAAAGDAVDKIKAFYGIAMLYVRHHPDGLRDLDLAADLLRDAHELIDQLDPAVRADPAMVFESVFNHNGQALILFRTGRVAEALGLLRSGIDRLTRTTEKVAIHRSVLLYNLAQCHLQLGDLDAAIGAYEVLLEVDPFMPEYHLEAARCLAAAQRINDAIDEVQRALALDDTIAAGWALLGLYRGRAGSDRAAADAYAQAARLEPERASLRLDQAYFLLIARDECAAELVLNGVYPRAASDVERHAGLLAETHVRAGDRRHAVAVITGALARFPGSSALRANLDVLTNA